MKITKQNKSQTARKLHKRHTNMDETLYPLHIDIQHTDTSAEHFVPSTAQMSTWFSLALCEHINLVNNQPLELTIRIVSSDESRQLNLTYRNKDKPTNVLSFPSTVPEFVAAQQDSLYLGDLVICPLVLENEARSQAKLCEHHWAHICIHGLLHLIGYDHTNDQEAMIMEDLEKTLLSKLNIDDPYKEH